MHVYNSLGDGLEDGLGEFKANVDVIVHGNGFALKGAGCILAHIKVAQNGLIHIGQPLYKAAVFNIPLHRNGAAHHRQPLNARP